MPSVLKFCDTTKYKKWVKYKW